MASTVTFEPSRAKHWANSRPTGSVVITDQALRQRRKRPDRVGVEIPALGEPGDRRRTARDPVAIDEPVTWQKLPVHLHRIVSGEGRRAMMNFDFLAVSCDFGPTRALRASSAIAAHAPSPRRSRSGCDAVLMPKRAVPFSWCASLAACTRPLLGQHAEPDALSPSRAASRSRRPARHMCRRWTQCSGRPSPRRSPQGRTSLVPNHESRRCCRINPLDPSKPRVLRSMSTKSQYTLCS